MKGADAPYWTDAMQARRVLPLALFMAAITAAAASAGALVALRNHCNPGYQPQAFSPEAWAEAGSERRGHMTDDLLASRDLRGMTTAEVVGLLGPPDDDQVELRRFRYRIGRRGRSPNCPLTDFSLLLRFDDHGQVATVDIAD